MHYEPQSFVMGRPPSFNLAHFQCHLPTDTDTQQLSNEEGQEELSCMFNFFGVSYALGYCLPPTRLPLLKELAHSFL